MVKIYIRFLVPKNLVDKTNVLNFMSLASSNRNERHFQGLKARHIK